VRIVRILDCKTSSNTLVVGALTFIIFVTYFYYELNFFNYRLNIFEDHLILAIINTTHPERLFRAKRADVFSFLGLRSRGISLRSIA
jgi:hypothetical protein